MDEDDDEPDSPPQQRKTALKNASKEPLFPPSPPRRPECQVAGLEGDAAVERGMLGYVNEGKIRNRLDQVCSFLVFESSHGVEGCVAIHVGSGTVRGSSVDKYRIAGCCPIAHTD